MPFDCTKLWFLPGRESRGQNDRFHRLSYWNSDNTDIRKNRSYLLLYCANIHGINADSYNYIFCHTAV